MHEGEHPVVHDEEWDEKQLARPGDFALRLRGQHPQHVETAHHHVFAPVEQQHLEDRPVVEHDADQRNRIRRQQHVSRRGDAFRLGGGFGTGVDWRFAHATRMFMTFSPRNLLWPCLLLATARLGVAQALPRTTAERTTYQATSTDADVGAFLDSLAEAGAPVALSDMGTSTLGHTIYLIIASDPAITTPSEAAASGKLVVYIQANIHAGEVEGKEAVLALLREIAGPKRALLQRLVVLVAPNYNPDGNDAFGPQAVNRSEQNGPEQVGKRADGMNLDLNRDYFKAEAPETRASLARVYATWDPALMVDLHTTDGTRHG